MPSVTQDHPVRARAWASSAGMPMAATPPRSSSGFVCMMLMKSFGTPSKLGIYVGKLQM